LIPSRTALLLWLLLWLLLGLLTGGVVAATSPALELKIKRLTTAGDHRGVARLLETWIDEHPADAEAGLRLGRAYLDGGNPNRAESAWRALLKQVGNRAELYLKIGEYAQRAALNDLAIDILVLGERELEGKPFSWQLSELYILIEDWPAAVTSLLAYMDQTANGYALAEIRLQNLARSDDSDPKLSSAGMLAALEQEAARRRESHNLELGTSGESDGLARVNVSSGPGESWRAEIDPLPVSLLLSSFALEVGRPDVGLAALAAIDHLPGAAGTIFQFATRCEAQGHDETAAAAYERFARVATDSPYRNRSTLRQAAIEQSSGRYAAALKTYQGVIDRSSAAQSPETAEALLHIGRLHLDLGEVAAARVALQALVDADGNQTASEVLIMLAECDLREDELDSAGQRLAMLLTPARRKNTGVETGLARFNLAEIAFFQGNFDGAIALIDSFLNQQPRHSLANDALALLLIVEDHKWQPEALAMFARARLRERQNRLDEAAAAWQWLDENGSDELSELSLLTRAQLREAEGLRQRALTLYELQASRFPEGRHALDARLGRARILARVGEDEQALKAYEASLLHFPDDARAPQMRLRIQELREQNLERGRG